jgi:lipopolysaccharide/colanic/teichoic acid biosynthesis glycosyltransferase
MPVAKVQPDWARTPRSDRVRELVVAVALILLTAPLIAVVALAIKSGSRGPILVREQRTGSDGRFIALKFRTTELRDAQARRRPATGANLTAVGRFIRHTRIEHLPQLINVLRGEMSCFPGSERPFFLD